jgi:hypothetical protein
LMLPSSGSVDGFRTRIISLGSNAFHNRGSFRMNS